MAGPLFARALLVAVPLALAGCDESGQLALFQQGPSAGAPETAAAAPAGSFIERDVEAPDVFAAIDQGLWDGRPSLGGVWVAHPDVTDPERAIIRNERNGEFVIGALFRRERTAPGPVLQVSSDAAEALGMLAGQPSQLNVVALRREQIPIEPRVDPNAAPEPVEEIAVAAIEETALDPAAPTPAPAETPPPAVAAILPPAPSASAGTGAAPGSSSAPAVRGGAAPVAVATAPQSASTLDRPFVQIGIFSVEQNASNTAASLRNIGIVPTVLQQESQGKTFWRVIVGPTTTIEERRIVLQQVRGLGFDDAYFVTN